MRPLAAIIGFMRQIQNIIPKKDQLFLLSRKHLLELLRDIDSLDDVDIHPDAFKLEDEQVVDVIIEALTGLGWAVQCDNE